MHVEHILCISGRNLADALALLDCQPHFISTVGSDPLGQCILHHNSKLDKKSIHINPSKATATYCLTLTNEGTYICIRLYVATLLDNTYAMDKRLLFLALILEIYFR